MPQTIIREGGTRNITWWDQYVGSMRGQYGIPSNYSEAAITEIDRSTSEILRPENIPDFDSEIWNENDGLRIGAAVGSIQSGKTANMIGVAAKGLDRGFRIVIVLGGLKNDLRSQTANRFCRDLLCKGENIIQEGVSLGSNHPSGKGNHGSRKECWMPSIYSDFSQETTSFCKRKITRNLKKGKSILIVTKKNVQTLAHLSTILDSVSRKIDPSEVPLLIIDDEFDEASVVKDSEAPTPERITQIWGARDHKVAYIGYTATIQANVLQDTDETLWPRDFIELIRYPAARDSALTFKENNHKARYTGPEVYFNYLRDHNERNFLVNTEMEDNEYTSVANTPTPILEKALISYFVSGAIRLLISKKSLIDTTNLASPHTMLIHTELEIEEHWGMVRRVMQLTRDKGGDTNRFPPNYRKIPSQDKIHSDHLRTWLENEADKWEDEYDGFRESTQILTNIQPDRPRNFPSWNEVKEKLYDVFLHTKLRVINSDILDDDLDFSPRTNEDLTQDLPNDVYSIVIGGNKLSRGLTLEGLCISYFCRSSTTIAEDTTVQRERWFGYRGGHLEFNRLFTNKLMADSLARFVYHEIDLKEQFVEAKRQGVKHWDSAAFRFLRMAHSTPSHALGRGSLRRIQFSGTKPFIQRVQMGESDLQLEYANHNVKILSDLCKVIIDQGDPVINSDREIGYCILNQSVDDVITLLEGLKFTFHNPNPKSRLFINLKNELKKPNHEMDKISGFSPAQDPYLIAAYLKYWKTGFEQGRNLQSNSGMEWTLSPPPKFNIAIRFGSLEAEHPFDFRLMDREIDEYGFMTSSWGSRGYGNPHTDEWFDQPGPHDKLPIFRPEGSNGLILILVVSQNSKGLDGIGEKYRYARPTLALSIPQGGPAVLDVDTGD